MVQNGSQIKNAARQLNINYENAKVICRTFRQEGRSMKKSSYKHMQAHSGALGDVWGLDVQNLRNLSGKNSMGIDPKRLSSGNMSGLREKILSK